MNQPLQQVLPAAEQDDDAIDLASYLDFLLDYKWLIASIALVVTLLGGAYALIATPVFEANILVQVEDSAGSSKNILGDLAGVFDLKTAATAEMEVLRSRMVISRAVDNAHLYIKAQPVYFPGIGAWMARRTRQLSEPGLFGAGGFVWGAEKIEVSVFNVPAELEGQRFTVTADGNGGFHLTHEEAGIDIKGRIGETLNASTEAGAIELRVETLAAKAGAQFRVVRDPKIETVERLQDSLKIAERGKQSGIIGVTLEGTDPKLTATILNEVGREYIRQNVDRKSEEAEKSLAFLNQQLPQLKQELERSENRYNELRNSRGTVDLTEEAKSVLQQSVLAQTRIVELRQKKEELLIRFQNDHPAVESINQQLQSLNREMTSIESKIKKMPSVEQDVFRLTRDVKVNTDLYTALLNTAQQLRLVKASKVGNARLLDTAVAPLKPIKPKRAIVVALAALIGVFLGVIGAFIRKSLYGGIDDPHEIERLLGLTVSATIPHSAAQERLYTQIQGKAKKVSVLAQEDPNDTAIESMRSFRTSLQFAMLDSRNNIIMITGPTPGLGKSFVSANFAVVLASTGKRVLLIDGDLRKGYLHRYFGLDRERGLSDAIASDTMLDQVIHKNVVEHVDFISTGNFPPKPAELLAHGNFGKLMKEVSSRYDFVVIDTAPVLAVSDALIVGAHAGSAFNVVRGGISTVGEIEESVKRFNQAGASVTGIVFNDLKPRSARYGYGSKYGKYRYAEYKY
jgi:tyrosine-protein kinase Etk/Wzc